MGPCNVSYQSLTVQENTTIHFVLGFNVLLSFKYSISYK